MDKILVSACLLGEKTRYDGKDNLDESLFKKLSAHYEIVPFCPEVEGGLPIPRPKSEIVGGRVMNEKGEDVTSHFVRGAEKAVEVCRFLGIGIAILKDGSPSCGPRKIYDGKFAGNKIDGLGVTARKLIEAGVKVYAETDALDFLFPERKVDERPYSKENPAAKKRLEERKKLRSRGKEGFRSERASHEGERKEGFSARGFKKDFKGSRPFRGKGGYKGKEGSFRSKEGSPSKGPGKGSFRGKKAFRGPEREGSGAKKNYGSKKKFFYSSKGKTGSRTGSFARKKKEQ